MAAEFLVLLIFPLLLALAAGWDLASYTIPNFLQIALIVSFGAFVFATGMTPGAVGWHVLAGFLGLFVGFTLFALGYVGGGDAKLFACITLWLGLRALPEYALMASLTGGALTLLVITMRQMPLPALLSGQHWIAKLHEARGPIPYAVALSAGVFLILPHAEIFRLAAAL